MDTTAVSQRVGRRWLDESRFLSVRADLISAKKASEAGEHQKAWSHLARANANYAKLPNTPQVLKLGSVAQAIQAGLPEVE